MGPFILRRLKTDRTIIQDLPEKLEMKVYTQLSKEQALLYRARVDQMDQDLAAAQGIERRGRILALLTHLKQICNHPSQFLKQTGPYKGRSGKLERLTDMLEEVLESGEKALVFTQFKEMGDRLQVHLNDVLGFEPPFLHGGSSREQRDEMVRSFQEDADGARVLLLSLKAGGVGLNLTAATHVFHFDRWWNPAVEDQATDRTYRIGQTRNVQVHKLITMGTLEEKIDAMLESKRDLADRVVGRAKAGSPSWTTTPCAAWCCWSPTPTSWARTSPTATATATGTAPALAAPSRRAGADPARATRMKPALAGRGRRSRPGPGAVRPEPRAAVKRKPRPSCAKG